MNATRSINLLSWFILPSRSKIFKLIYGDIIIAGRGLQYLDIYLATLAFEQGEILYRAAPVGFRDLTFCVSFERMP